VNGTLGSLFSGCGGLDLGLHYAGLECIWACENDAAARGVFQRHWPTVPIAADVRQVDAGFPAVDVLAGGFPCQDLSQAGLRAGLAVGTRSGLWFEFARAIRVLRPRVVIVENVPGLLTAGFGIVASDLAALGYVGRWCCFRASDLGAPHSRERIFIVASDSERVRVDADRGVLGGGAGVADGSAQAPLPAWEEVACAADAGANGGSAASDAGSERRDGHGVGDTQGEAGVGIDGRTLPEGSAAPTAVAGQSESQGAERQESEEVGQREASLGSAEATGGHRHPAAVDWGAYAAAVETWEELTRTAPRPTDDRGRLSPAFVEWMLGFPAGWTEAASRTQRLKMLGNSVQVQVAELVGLAVGQLL
jgi:DNA (cytosine-5)-methyltransferase 1